MTASLSMSLSLAMPELILAVGAMALLMVGAFSGERSSGMVTFLAILLMIVAGAWIILVGGQGTAFGGAFVVDNFARFMKILSLIGSVVALFMSTQYIRAERFEKFEYPVLIVLSTLGMMLMISASNMIGLYLGLELQSFAIYVLAAIHRDDLKSSEAGLKYFVLGALASGLLLYGISLVYGYTGSTGFHEIAAALSGGRQLGLIFGLVFLMAGIAFKISAVPFHMWTPDVYEGAPTPVTTFMASAPKMAAMALMVRVTVGPFEPIAHEWQQIIVFISIASMVLGSFAAIGQRNFKRLMAYSSIGHVGYALVGLAANTQAGVRGVVIYMLIYLMMTLGTFAVILSMRRKEGYLQEISDLSGLSQTNPMMATILTILMFSLAGIPPLAGFWGKWYVFLAAINANLYTLAVIGVLASVVGAYYYLRIIKIMWFDEPAAAYLPTSANLRIVLGVSGLFMLFYVLIGGPISTVAEAAAKSFSDRMGFVLAPSAALAGYRLDAHDSVGSTNSLALEAARAGDPGNLWIVSKRQESGRGRRGRAWETPHGNLAATLLARSDFDLKLAATLGFVAGLSLADALAAIVPGKTLLSVAADGGSGVEAGGGEARFTLKWPNDVLARGRKLAGILLESTLLDGGRFTVAVGIGVNVVAYPDDLPYPATSLAAMGAKCDAETLFLALSDAWMKYVGLWDNGRGLDRIRTLWLKRAAGLGGEVAVRVGDRIVRGIFETIDEECRFVIRDPSGAAIPIAAGDVHFGAVASAGAA